MKIKVFEEFNDKDIENILPISNQIQHCLDVAKPSFLYFITNMNPELSKWIQYTDVEVQGSSIVFNFKSSQNSLKFSVYGGVNSMSASGNPIYNNISGRYKEIYQYFKKLKYDNI
jgi:hypothetical protein